MGKEKYLKKIELLFDKSSVVSYDSIERIVKNKKKVRQYAKKLIHYLLQRGKIKRITKGYYTTREEVSLAVFAFQPAYLGLQDALSFHNLWEQETIPVVITTRKVRQGIRKVFGQNILIRRISKKYFFGIEHALGKSYALPYSDVEKTFVDFIYFKENLTKEVIKEFKLRINRKKLNIYLKKYPAKLRKKVFAVYFNKKGN